MKERRFAPCNLGKNTICLGKQGEANHLRIEFDCSGWLAEFPDAIIVLYYFAPERAEDNPFRPVLSEEGTDRVWIVSEVDTMHAGNGVIELVLEDAETAAVLKSATGYTSVTYSPSAMPLSEDDGGDNEGSGGGTGEDGGYYKPSVSSAGVLSWQPSKSGMPSVPSSNIKGPAGKDGNDGGTGPQGPAGKDGYSPVITVTNITGGHRVTITDANGTKSFDVLNGTGGSGEGSGAPGADGFSPIISVIKIEGGHRVTITDVTGTSEFDVMDGKNGEDEVYVGETEPTDPNVKVWINPEGEATIPGGGTSIDDSKPSSTTTYSSQKIDELLNAQKEAIDEELDSLSEDIVEKLNPAITKAGSVVNINAMPGFPMKVISNIVPAQSGEGTPSPDNVRPFIQREAVTVTVGNEDGENSFSAQLGENAYLGSYDFSTGLLTVTGAAIQFVPQQRTGYGSDGFALYQMWNYSGDNLAVSDGNAEQYCSFSKHKYALKSNEETFYAYGDTYNVNSAKWSTLEEAQAWFAANDAKIVYTLATPYTVQVDPQVIIAMSGETTVKSDAGDVTVTAIGTMSVLEQTPAQKYGMSMLQYVHMPRFLLSGSTEGMTKENEVVLSFEYRGAEDYTNAGVDLNSVRESGVIHNGYVKIKWQGSSSLAYPKKNYTIKTYADEACKEKLPITFRTRWGAQTKYCLKANYIDPSHSRNVVAAKLWADCVKTRDKTSESYLMMNALPNYGAIDGYPILVFINDEYVGLYTLNIPKDEWMFGMKDGEGGNAVLCAETYNDATNFSGPIVGDGSDWKFEVSPAIEANAIYSFNQIYAALSMPENTEDEIAAKKAALEPYCDIYSVIDYDIFIKRIGATDNMGKNQLFARYFGKWCASAYDMDTAFGNFWSGVKYLPATQEIESNNLGATVARLYPDIYNARKTELHNGVLSAPAILDKLFNFMIDVPQEAYLAEAQLWPEMCGANANAMQQIAAFVMMRCD